MDYTYNIANATLNLLPPNKRKATSIAYLSASDTYLQYLHDLFFNGYADGDSSGDYNNAAPYAVGVKVRYIDNKIYERIGIGSTTGTIPTDTDFWIPVLNNFIGVRERARYTSNRVVFEYALNKWFKTQLNQFTAWDGAGNPTPLSDIYIQNTPVDTNSFVVGVDEEESSSIWLTDSEQMVSVINLDYFFNPYMFVINIPIAVYDALLPSEPGGITTPKDNVVRAFADNYVLGGVTYTIAIY